MTKLINPTEYDGGATIVALPVRGETDDMVTTPEAGVRVIEELQHEFSLYDPGKEHCWCLHLDTKHRLIAATLVSVGSVDHTFMAPREIYRDALLIGASAIVVSHNHPSGDPGPSKDDFAVTRRLSSAGEMVGVNLLDHLVTAEGDSGTRWQSIARLGGGGL